VWRVKMLSPEDRKIFMSISQDQCMALEVYGEARGEPDEGKIAVCSVVLNREDFGLQHPAWGKLYGGDTANAVILDPWQFSSFNPTDPNFPTLKAIAMDFWHHCIKGTVLDHCHDISLDVLSRFIPRNVKAIYYETIVNQSMPHSLYHQFSDKLGREPKVEQIIGKQIFYDEFA
jgi:hypothetical protein